MSLATDKLAEYLAAESAALKGHTVEIDGTRFTSEDLDQIQTGRRLWERRVAQEQSGSAGPRHSQASFAQC